MVTPSAYGITPNEERHGKKGFAPCITPLSHSPRRSRICPILRHPMVVRKSPLSSCVGVTTICTTDPKSVSCFTSIWCTSRKSATTSVLSLTAVFTVTWRRPISPSQSRTNIHSTRLSMDTPMTVVVLTQSPWLT